MPQTVARRLEASRARPPSASADGVKRVSVLGATGSVGKNTLDLIGRNPNLFQVVALTANRNAQALAELAVRHRAELAVVADESRYGELKERLAGTGIEAAAGPAGLIDAASRPADCVMAGISGAAGLRPTLAAVAQGRRVALANKECLVCAGEIFMEAVRSAGTELVPVEFRAFRRVPGDRRLRSGSHRAHRAHGIGRPVPHLEPGAPGGGDAAGGAEAPQLVDGPQDHDRFGHADEQGPGADRGLSSVSCRSGSARGGRASAVDHPRAGRLPRRLDAGATRKPRHAHPHCRRLGLAGRAWPPRPSASISWSWAR